MQYVRSIGGSVSKTWNSINPATLSGAIDVIVIEQGDGSLACSPFHVRFGKFSLLRPYEKKVEFRVNGAKQEHAMKLGEGGEAFFVFETSIAIPEALQTSPLVSPASSPDALKPDQPNAIILTEPTYLDIADDTKGNPSLEVSLGQSIPILRREGSVNSDQGTYGSLPTRDRGATIDQWSAPRLGAPALERSASEEVMPISARDPIDFVNTGLRKDVTSLIAAGEVGMGEKRASTSPPISTSPPSLKPREALHRAMTLSKKLSTSNISSQVTESGDLKLDMTGYKTSEDEALRAEGIARKILSEEIEGNYDIGSLIGTDENGNLWIYSSEEARDAANRKAVDQSLNPTPLLPADASSDPGYHSDSERSESPQFPGKTHQRTLSDDLALAPRISADTGRNFAKTLRLTSDQLKHLELKPGANPMSFTVNKATCHANMYLWSHDVPIVISDIDGTITKSDALGHLLNMVGRDWTHVGVAKLYTDIVSNGYNIFYLTSRSVGQADTTRAYLHGVIQEGWKLPKGPVILSPDRTIAALRREVYLRKPEVFKMACLRDILNLFPGRTNPFYAGFGNRFTDALSYRTVNIPSTRIFTINSNAEVSLDLLTLNKYKSSYVSMREAVDHFFPPVAMLVKEGGEAYTDFTYWRDTPHDLEDFMPTDSEDGDDEEADEGEDDEEMIESDNDLDKSYLSRDSIDDSTLEESVRESIEVDPVTVAAAAAAKLSLSRSAADRDFLDDYLGDRAPTGARLSQPPRSPKQG